MNEVIEQLRQRKSVRVFKDMGIPAGHKNEIINAAFEAPSAGCMMLYTILDITDQAIKDQLAELCDHQPFIAKAPMVLVFLADYQKWYDVFEYTASEIRRPAEGELYIAFCDAMIAAQNTVVAAHSLGIGSCYIGDIVENKEEISKLLSFPEYVLPAAMLVFGYPEQSQIDRKKPMRFDRDYVVCENTYKKISPEQIMDFHTSRNLKSGTGGKDTAEYLQAFCTRKYMSDFAIEMSRSAAEYFSKFHNSSK